MDNRMMTLMMVACVGMAVLFYAVPSGWPGGGIGIVLLAVILFACCIPMIKMMWKGDKQDGEA